MGGAHRFPAPGMAPRLFELTLGAPEPRPGAVSQRGRSPLRPSFIVAQEGEVGPWVLAPAPRAEKAAAVTSGLVPVSVSSSRESVPGGFPKSGSAPRSVPHTRGGGAHSRCCHLRGMAQHQARLWAFLFPHSHEEGQAGQGRTLMALPAGREVLRVLGSCPCSRVSGERLRKSRGKRLRLRNDIREGIAGKDLEEGRVTDSVIWAGRRDRDCEAATGFRLRAAIQSSLVF